MTNEEFYSQPDEAIDPVGEWAYDKIKQMEITRENSGKFGDFIQNDFLRIHKRWLTNEPLNFMPMHGCCIPGIVDLFVLVDGNFKWRVKE